MDHAPEPRSIAQILANKDCFRVAAYQRGFKWREPEVKQLLDDLEIFRNDTTQAGTSYCLLPLVVTRREGECEVIDGQQRLTTIFLILRYLGHEAFLLRHDTRHGSTEFLKRIADWKITKISDWQSLIDDRHQDGFADNVDNFHFFNAAKTIDLWFDERLIDLSSWLPFLLNHVSFIWSEVEETDAEKTFLNLNSGRIPLKATEKIKALFLKAPVNANAHEPPLRTPYEIAHEWDGIEHTLHDKALWGFLNPPKEFCADPARITFVFHVLLSNQLKGSQIFEHYAGLQNEGKFKAAEQWVEVNDCFLRLQEWFTDRDLFHKIGFLLAEGLANGESLWRESHKKTQPEFRAWLAAEIGNKLRVKPLEDLRYGTDDQLIRRILLWFNIKTLHGDTRFSFDRYVGDKWSLEHIHAQNSDELEAGNQSQWDGWKKDVVPQLQRLPNKPEIDSLIDRIEKPGPQDGNPEAQKEHRTQLMDEVWQCFGPELESQNPHGIDNLALLSCDANSSLSNSLFPIKRDKIIAAEMAGDFIPPATKNVFLKYYHGDVHQMWLWTPKDRKAYLREIQSTCKDELQPSELTPL